MWRKLGLTIAYAITAIYILSIAMPAYYCYAHGCRGPGELDAFMPAFVSTPIGAIATGFSLRNTIEHIRKRHYPWAFWPLAILFTAVLLSDFALIAWIIYHTVARR